MILKVTPRSAEPWVGTFAFGYPSPPALTAAFGCPDERMLCVISAGQGYTVMSDDPSRWCQLAPFPIIQALPIPSKRIIVFADLTTLTGYRNEVPLWQTDQLSFDGIDITEIAHGYLKGRGWHAPDQKGDRVHCGSRNWSSSIFGIAGLPPRHIDRSARPA
jgi:hypothetical protein